MNRFRHYVLMAVGFAVLVMVVGIFSAGPAIAQAVRAALVQNRDEPARQPFKLQVTGGFSGEQWKVPAQKRYVIEQYSMLCSVDRANGGALGDVSVTVANGLGASVEDHASAPHSIDFSNINPSQIKWAASATTRLYADPADFITLEGTPNGIASGAGAHSCVGSVSGYAIDLP
ncbi:MAG: hypothetical protein LAQ69_09100 [Acidobacteriia bacterium]|nr:hypothetical protein [Terriglobia bacterium]